MRRLAIAAVVLVIATAWFEGQPRAGPRAKGDHAPVLEGAKAEVYKTAGDVKLQMYVYFPEGHRAADKRPAIVFFFGGGWRSGSPRQFEAQCKYLASRGMVALAADYRVLSRHGTKAVRCVEDGKSAIRWVRANADRLGIDPDRIAAGGGSAGGHVAACTATIAGLDEPNEDASICSVPNALVLFNPALVLAPVAGVHPFRPDRSAEMADRIGADPLTISPYHHVRRGVPPTIIFHGTADTTVPFRTSQWFARAMEEAGNECTLVAFDGAEHGFFNHGRGDGSGYVETVRAMDRFLAGLGYLEGEPALEAPRPAADAAPAGTK